LAAPQVRGNEPRQVAIEGEPLAKSPEADKTLSHPGLIGRLKRRVSRTRLVMVLLLIVAIPVFVFLANKAVHENADAIMQVLGR
jgi:hypothetical protein